MNFLSLVRPFLLWVGLALAPAVASALTAEQVRAMAIGENDARAAAIAQAAASGDAQAPVFFQALLDGVVKVAGDQVFIVRDDKVHDAATGAEAALPDGADDVINSNRMRREIEGAIASLKLLSPDVAQRALAIKELKDQADESKLPLVEKAYAVETDPKLKAELGLLRAAVLVSSADKGKRLEAARALTESHQPATKTLLLERLKPGVESDDEVRGQLQLALGAIESRLAWGERLGVVFTGLSLGSILLLVALGLAITYGLMGVINMAH
ncbi:MAG TPA: urea ABC transporter permease subunit UrtB, partial [Caldimonas sp.]